ncbi:MAG: HPr family phosphocarrier protein [Caldicoprobacterales bacterium]
MYSIEKQIRLGELTEVRDFVVLASKYQCDVKVKSKNSVTDGKSILGILSLGLWRPITVTASGVDAKKFEIGLERFEAQ